MGRGRAGKPDHEANVTVEGSNPFARSISPTTTGCAKRFQEFDVLSTALEGNPKRFHSVPGSRFRRALRFPLHPSRHFSHPDRLREHRGQPRLN